MAVTDPHAGTGPEDDLRYAGPHPEQFGALPAEQRRSLLLSYAMAAGIPGCTILIGNVKGGAGKSTTAMFLAVALGLSGDQVLVVDTDAENQSCLVWSAATAEWPSNIKVVAWAGPSVSPQRMVELIREQRPRYRWIIIDTSPYASEYLRAALQVTDELIVPTKPTVLDVSKVPATFSLAREVEQMSGRSILTTVLFTQARKNTLALADFYRTLRDKGYALFDGGMEDGEVEPIPFAISNRVSYADSAYTVPTDLGEYVPVLRQLIEGRLDAAAADVTEQV
jgi:chromosome partitioning protein